MTIQENTEKSNVRAPKSLQTIKEESQGTIENILNSPALQEAYKKIDDIVDSSKGGSTFFPENEDEQKEDGTHDLETKEPTINEPVDDTKTEPEEGENPDTEESHGDGKNETVVSVEDKLNYYKKKLRSEQKQKYSIYAEKLKLAEEKEKLAKMLDDAYKGSLYHHSRNVYSEYERTKAARKMALENGDNDAFLAADEAYQNAFIDLKEFQRIEAQEKQREILQSQNNIPNINSNNVTPNNQNAYASVPTSEEQLRNAIIFDWVKANPEIDPESPFFNEDLEKKVTSYVMNHNKFLQDEGREHERLTDNYFRDIENYMNKIKSSNFNGRAPSNPPSLKSQEASIPISGVAPSKTSSNIGTAKKDKPQIKFSHEEEAWIRQGYMTREALTQSKLKQKGVI